ncbi:MAG TPA: hypothetical protein VD884_09590 [Ohtaekwangia sp.]|nr:hypothetical protein [Ohtaekwangia sp.]
MKGLAALQNFFDVAAIVLLIILHAGSYHFGVSASGSLKKSITYEQALAEAVSPASAPEIPQIKKLTPEETLFYCSFDLLAGKKSLSRRLFFSLSERNPFYRFVSIHAP